MTSNNLTPAAPVDEGDWRATLNADLRPRNVEKIFEALKRDLQFSGPEGVQELKIIAELFEEKMYAAATSESDYLHKISLKTLPVKQTSPFSVPSSLLSKSSGTDNEPTGPGDSTVQTDETNGVDWREEVYQKIKTMEDMYLPELNEMRQKFDAKLQEQPKTGQLEKLKMFKIMVDRMLSFLQVSKDDVQVSFKDKLISYERQIITFLNVNRPRKPMPPMQQGQLPSSHMQSLQQPLSQITQAQFHENQMIPMTMHGSVSAMQQNNNMMNSMQTDSMASLQQGAMGSLQQNPISSPPASLSSVPSQNGLTTLQTSLPLQTNPNNMLHQYQHQLQPYQQIQKPLMQQGMLQQQQWHQQCSQLLTLHQKAREQQEMLQLHQVAGVNEVKPNISSLPNVNAVAVPSIGQPPQESLAIGTTRVVVPDYGARGNDALATGKSTVAEQQSPDGAQVSHSF
ncbi:unnamed protein product [Linum tenue]|uniref:Mediator complex subunit 15 KIX domain-containing protein n=1 Tax=Linum tenue TaxID=586396 RepID=A0AAV0NLJ6_9ROSI|nr:unnamed protein product [Linum tenue]